MNRFLVLYVGPATPPDASHEGWPEWFAKLGDRLVDRGSPIVEGRALHGDGSTGDAAAQLNGYSINPSRAGPERPPPRKSATPAAGGPG
jgi:hypothetical protein